ncbi:hypothetical protein GIB67_001249 [Kingdonia uniflora]|uniref:Peptidase A1 domain-containing protein n=1 Tax=Kingdonia uniflora TaxID=39325 RepID=A0A7J7L7P8_9MAGN|nr:hypothetical protein GIB67_001249 [Kingdonia uniflora]
MASYSLQLFLLFALILISTTFSNAQTSSRPRTLVLPVLKDGRTQQYLTHINQRTPLAPVKLSVDLGNRFLWINCEDSGYVSSTYQPSQCGSPECVFVRSSGCSTCYSSPKPGCNNNTCSVYAENTITRTGTGGEFARDVVTLKSSSGSVVTVPNILFTCGAKNVVKGLASGVTGMLGLGKDRVGFPTQLAVSLRFDRKFAVCLSPSTKSNGIIFFGNGPYISQKLAYTPLLDNPVSTAAIFVRGEHSVEYFIGVKAININGKPVLSINTTLLSIGKRGGGGTKISTINRYTTMETSIFNAFTNAFIKEAGTIGITRTASVAPFSACFTSKTINVPNIDLVLQSQSVYWRIVGRNSMVDVGNNVHCLGFVDGGLNPETSIVIGAYQIEDNLLEFDITASKLGFSSSLLLHKTNCAKVALTSKI